MKYISSDNIFVPSGSWIGFCLRAQCVIDHVLKSPDVSLLSADSQTNFCFTEGTSSSSWNECAGTHTYVFYLPTKHCIFPQCIMLHLANSSIFPLICCVTHLSISTHSLLAFDGRLHPPFETIANKWTCLSCTGKCNLSDPWPLFNMKMSSYQYRKSHCGDGHKIMLFPRWDFPYW